MNCDTVRKFYKEDTMKKQPIPITRWVSRLGTILILAGGILYISAHVSLVYPAVPKNDALLELRRDPRVRAFLNMIAYAEGTSGTSGYRMQYTKALFYDYSDHPREIICAVYGSTGKELCSSAAGRYQFLQKTWDYVAPKVEAANFGPLHQDRAAIFLLLEKGAIELILRNDIESAIQLMNKTWASFPGSPYGQKTYSLSHLKDVYMQQLRTLGGRA